jgi:hypothetical protein
METTITQFTEQTRAAQMLAADLMESACDEDCESIQSRLAITADTMEAFAAVWGKPSKVTPMPFGCPTMHVWKNIQRDGKGTERGDLKVCDFGSFRVASFL